MNLTISSSVGKGARNFPKDVKCVQALLNVYLRTTKSPFLIIDGVNSPSLEAAIKRFQTEHMKLARTADGRVDSAGNTFRLLKLVLSSVFVAEAITAPNYGVVTWASEGQEGGRYHSRKLHVPSPSSGLTLGRGYDCYRKSPSKIKSDLMLCGLGAREAELLGRASGLSGTAAAQFIIDNDLLDFQISPSQQKALFKVSYDEQATEARRICEKPDVKELYGETDWEKIHHVIREITIDLKFRGDYTRSSRKLIQTCIAGNDLVAFTRQLKDRSKWPHVPPNRFERRAAFLDNAK